MNIKDRNIYTKATAIIKRLYGPQATFRPGQYEAIEATMLNKRTLVVQKTGWGKSLVYFICTKLMREQGRGVTLVVSPLLVLMENQLEAAEKIGLRCDVLNGQTTDRHGVIIEEMMHDELDLVLVTPETLLKDSVQQYLPEIKIGMFVIDEAHCISDWGHDFRLSYFRLRNIIQLLPKNTPILGTTATANDRVIKDLQKQMGENIHVSRGPLTRDSLWLQVFHMPSSIERYAWILENINKLPGTGIIYCSTQKDCEYLADFLQSHGIAAMSYFSRDTKDEALNREAEKALKENKIKVIVATIKLGMGYDKGDIAFIIHYQCPKNIISYYQQIGRAGRNLDKAYVFLMCGSEDERISRYFIDTAFPTKEEEEAVLKALREADGSSLTNLLPLVNKSRGRIEKSLMFLMHDGFIYYDESDSKYRISPKPFVYDQKHYDELVALRLRELQDMHDFTYISSCYSKYLVNSLGDTTAENCGHCANCLHKELLPSKVSAEGMKIAREYLSQLSLVIEPRKMWPVKIEGITKRKIDPTNEKGICLAKYGQAPFGELVHQNKYSPAKRFDDRLVERSSQVLRTLLHTQQIRFITNVPSLRSDLVEDFTKRLAKKCNLTYVELLGKTASEQQKDMENSVHQCLNAYHSFYVLDSRRIPDKILLVDDIVDSGWTLTVCGQKLLQEGCTAVYPFALADSSK